MHFNSPQFLLFSAVIVILHYFLPYRYKASLLVFASFLFIGYFNIQSLFTVITLTLINFFIALKIENKPYLYYISILLNSSSIVAYNYSHTTSIYDTTNLTNLTILLGLLFYSLNNIAYQTEVYFKRILPETSVINYTLYITFFPKFISGPIELPNEFIPQIGNNKFNTQSIIKGFNRFLLGLLKKMVVADRLAPAVHSIFDFSDNYSGLTTLTGVYIYTVQLYFNFSGYSDMAIGVAKMLGYNLKENFFLPFRATSITEFWRRWHISLMNWFGNYVYYPVAYYFRKQKKLGVFIAIFFTFLISGIWHGIGAVFIIWALCHIVFMSYELFTKQLRLNISKKLNPFIYKTASVFVVFNLVCLSDIFLRTNFSRSTELLQNIFTNFLPNDILVDFIAPLAVGGHQQEQFNFGITIFLTLFILLFERRINKFSNNETFSVYYTITCILTIMVLGVFNAGERFIYMQF